MNSKIRINALINDEMNKNVAKISIISYNKLKKFLQISYSFNDEYLIEKKLLNNQSVNNDP